MNNAIEFQSGTSKLKLTSMGNIKYPVFHIATNKKFSMGIPLERHIRTLVDMFGYDEIKRLVDNYPDSLKVMNK